MPRINPEEKKAKLKEKLARIEAELEQANAQARVAQKQQEIRAQILAGRIAVRHMEAFPNDPWSKKFSHMLDIVIHGKDRALFPVLDSQSQGVTDVSGSEMVHSPSDR